MSKINIRTPHAAVLIWNYIDRFGKDSITNSNGTEKLIISTLSCTSIQTTKSKGKPDGAFTLTLAPYKNWVETITPGSWCCILMSNEPITENDLKKANKKHVKMIGKIETVRVDTTQDDDTRRTMYTVTGVDWGHIFNNVLYIDNLIASKNDPASQGNAAAVAIRKALFGSNDGSPKSFFVKDNLRSIINIFGQSLDGFTKAGLDINRLAKSIYNFKMPKEMVEYFDFKAPSGKVSKAQELNKVLNLVTGSLKTADTYEDKREARGYIDPFSLQGTNTFWQILMENSNPALNEMIAELRWDTAEASNGVAFTLYNRIKPFSFKDFKTNSPSKGLKSYFQNVKKHEIDPTTVKSLNAGTNWRDKYNFVEIKPQFQDFNIIGNWYKQKSQKANAAAFEREGFRPLIVGTKQFPSGGQDSSSNPISIDMAQLEPWVDLLKDWYFDTHRMLNGTITMTGSTQYIGVGDNIMFDAGLVNPTPNMNQATLKKQQNFFVLAHVENISHSFSVSQDGARSFTTTIQFVRGIIVNKDGSIVGEGTLDKLVDKVPPNSDVNTLTNISTSDSQDPDPQKVKGT